MTAVRVIYGCNLVVETVLCEFLVVKFTSCKYSNFWNFRNYNELVIWQFSFMENKKWL